MTKETLIALQKLRDKIGKPLRLSSAYRCPRWNNKISSTGKTGPHTTGMAVDILCKGEFAHEVLRLAMESRNWTGIGISQKGNHNSRFIHLDTISIKPNRPWVWSY